MSLSSESISAIKLSGVNNISEYIDGLICADLGLGSDCGKSLIDRVSAIEGYLRNKPWVQTRG